MPLVVKLRARPELPRLNVPRQATIQSRRGTPHSSGQGLQTLPYRVEMDVCNRWLWGMLLIHKNFTEPPPTESIISASWALRCSPTIQFFDNSLCVSATKKHDEGPQ
jgi:hypothetical protein